MIDADRIVRLNDKDIVQGRYVLYWMQASGRVEYNHALEYAVRQGNELNRPVVVYFGVWGDYPSANLRHYHFMLGGLREVEGSLRERGIKLVVRLCWPPEGAIELAESASMVVTDRGYLRVQKQWREEVGRKCGCRVVQVESDVVVPVGVVSDKVEYAARTIRPKINKRLDEYVKTLTESDVREGSLDLRIDSVSLDDIDGLLDRLGVDDSVGPVPFFKPGTSEAKRLLRGFIRSGLEDYDQARNDPNVEGCSQMSPYLHFGQISPLYIAYRVMQSDKKGREAYLEELIVRRELAINFVNFERDYDKYKAVPGWAKIQLREHKADKREYVYSVEEFEDGRTHDAYWNAAQMQMVLTGKMHGYMRMYWGKKILEWSKTPQSAYKAAIYLNDKYELDGRDANGYTGVAWCFGKHDRPWSSRSVYGSVRYMNDAGLRRKFDADGYVAKIEKLREDLEK